MSEEPTISKHLLNNYTCFDIDENSEVGLGCQTPSKILKVMKGNNIMKRVVRIFVVDSDSNILPKDSILYQSSEFITDATDQELWFDIDIKTILTHHNVKRQTIIDKKLSEKMGKDIFLEPIRVRDLKMVVTEIATF